MKQTVEDGKPVSLKKFVELKPQLASEILEKLWTIIQKLMEKGLARHSICQALIAEFVSCCEDDDEHVHRIKLMAEDIKEKMPCLLASR